MDRTAAGAPPRIRTSCESEPMGSLPDQAFAEHDFCLQIYGCCSSCRWWRILNVHGATR